MSPSESASGAVRYDSPIDAATAAAVGNSDRGWIQSPAFDLALFILSPIAGLIVIFGQLGTPLGAAAVTAAVYLVGIPHYLSSFTFFLGDENLSYYKSRYLAFFAGPVVIFLLVFALRGMHVPYIVQAVIFTWNIYHVALQSAGILSLYRRLNGGDQAERNWAHMTILGCNATMAFWFLDRFPPLFILLQGVHPDLPLVLRYGALVMALVAGAGYAMRLAQRKNPFSFPEKTFLASSLLLFHPYLWVENSLLATAGMLMGHFIQYLAIVWLLNRRKYIPPVGSWRQRWLGRVSASVPYLVTILISIGVFFFLMDRGSRVVGLYSAYIVLWNSVVLMHFYVDGLVWAFKDPFVRRTVGPYVTPENRRVFG